jgi:hypothetical protein
LLGHTIFCFASRKSFCFPLFDRTHKYHFVVELKWKSKIERTLLINEEDEKLEKEKESQKRVSGVNIINVFIAVR